jgi:hypothetical protein
VKAGISVPDRSVAVVYRGIGSSWLQLAEFSVALTAKIRSIAAAIIDNAKNLSVEHHA